MASAARIQTCISVGLPVGLPVKTVRRYRFLGLCHVIQHDTDMESFPYQGWGDLVGNALFAAASTIQLAWPELCTRIKRKKTNVLITMSRPDLCGAEVDDCAALARVAKPIAHHDPRPCAERDRSHVQIDALKAVAALDGVKDPAALIRDAGRHEHEGYPPRGHALECEGLSAGAQKGLNATRCPASRCRRRRTSCASHRRRASRPWICTCKGKTCRLSPP
jgi:hypothetical protein